MQGNPNEVNPVARGGTDVAWGNVPGLEQFYNYDIPSNQSTFNLSAALPEIQRLGYQVMQAEDPGAETMASWVAGPDDQPTRHGPRHWTGTNEDNFKLAALAAMGITGANVLGAGLGATGAAQAGGAAAPTGMTAEQAAMLAANSPVGNAGGLAAWEAAQAGSAAAGAAGAAGSAGGLMNAAAPAAAGGLLSGIPYAAATRRRGTRCRIVAGSRADHDTEKRAVGPGAGLDQGQHRCRPGTAAEIHGSAFLAGSADGIRQPVRAAEQLQHRDAAGPAWQR
ncbi:MAG: hypothetical protein IPK42_25580 [Betaproteobacteria bacterium]|nr:hypothetical protein [Betaproteobacteria bacterium]